MSVRILHERRGDKVPPLTILVCAYNQAAFIGECLDSVAACQSAADIELIVIDDGSTDGSAALAAAHSFPPAMDVLVLTKPNGGLTGSLHLGLARARGAYLLIIAADDWYLPGALDRLLAGLPPRDGPPRATVYQAHYAGALSGPVYGAATARLFSRALDERLRALSRSYPKPLLLQSTLFEIRLLRELEPWADGLLLDDWPTFLRIAEAATHGQARLDFQPGLTLCAYRVHDGGVHNDGERQRRACLQVVDRVVAPRWRAPARAGVLGDLALVQLAERRPGRALRLYARALAADPGPRALFRLPAAVARGALRRLGRALS